MQRRRNVTVTEFAVEVKADHIEWDGMDAFLLWFLRSKPEGGFLPHAQAISRLRAKARRASRSK